MKVLVTVGTTSFDMLIERIDSVEIKEELNKNGYSSIVCQIGQGSYKPSLEYFAYDDNIDDMIESSDLIICHGGAGSILSALRKGKKVIAVVNPSLMHNHQLELASELLKRKHILMCANPGQLLDTVMNK